MDAPHTTSPHTEESITKLIERGYALYRSDHLSYFLKLAITVELRKSPERGKEVVERLLNNILEIEKNGKKTINDFEWEKILMEKSPSEIANILESNSDNSQRLRSNLCAHGIIPEDKREKIIHNHCYGKTITPALILHG